MAKLVLDQDVGDICQQICEPLRVVPLNDGQVLVADMTYQYRVLRVDQDGQQQGATYTSGSHFPVSALRVHQDSILLMQLNGAILRRQLSDLSKAIQTYKVKADYHLAGGDVIDEDTLAFTVSNEGNVYVYNMKTHKQNVVLSGLNEPYSLAYAQTKEGPVFILTERGTCQVHVYDQAWKRLYSMGGQGSGDGQLDDPRCAVLTDDGSSILVADYKNRRVSEFTKQGEFVCHLLTDEDGLGYPLYVACRDQYVWVICSQTTAVVTEYSLKRFKRFVI